MADKINTMLKYKWNLRGYLNSKGLKPSQVANSLGSISRAPTIYRLSSPKSDNLSRIDFNTLNDLIEVLSELTGEDADTQRFDTKA